MYGEMIDNYKVKDPGEWFIGEPEKLENDTRKRINHAMWQEAENRLKDCHSGPPEKGYRTFTYTLTPPRFYYYSADDKSVCIDNKDGQFIIGANG